MARGGVDILPLYRGSEQGYSLSISLLSQTLMRDHFQVANLLPRLDLMVDTLWLPFFSHYEDTGIRTYQFPINLRAGLLYHYLAGSRIQASAGVWMGSEWVTEYHKLYWGLEHTLAVRLLPAMLWGLRLQAAEAEFSQGLTHLLLQAETGFGFFLGRNQLYLAYLFTEQYHNPATREDHGARLGLVFPLPRDFQLNTGITWFITQGSWMAGLGLEMGKIMLFKRPFYTSSALTYQPVGGFSFHLSARWAPLLKAAPVP